MKLATQDNPKKLSSPQRKMLEALGNAPGKRLKTKDHRQIRTLNALVDRGLAVRLWGPSPTDPHSLYAIRNDQNKY